MDMLINEAISNEFAKSVVESDKYGPISDSQKETVIQLIENTQADIQKTLNEGTLTLKDWVGFVLSHICSGQKFLPPS